MSTAATTRVEDTDESILCSARSVDDSNEAEQDGEEEGADERTIDPYDPGTPEPLSPIEEMEDEAQSVRPTWKDTDSEMSSSLRDEPAKQVGTVDSGHASVDESTGGPLSLEHCTDLLLSRQHLQAILADRGLALKFTTFLRIHRPHSVPILTYYLDAIKALKTIRYADSIIRSLGPIPGHAFTTKTNSATMAWVMEDKADQALDVLVRDDMPAFIAYTYVRAVDLALMDRVTGKQDLASRTLAEGLAEVFVLSDPSRPDNPIVFSSEEFHTMTGWSRKEVLGRNCRLLGGNRTSPFAIHRFRASLDAEREHCEILLNYHRDGSPFINLIMCVPLRDKTNRVRYYLGAQLDITGLVSSFAEFSSLRKVVQQEEKNSSKTTNSEITSEISIVDELVELGETFSPQELEQLLILRRHQQAGSASLLPETDRIPEKTLPRQEGLQVEAYPATLGFYKDYLLVRPHPSLRILFASPELRSSGILQQPLMKSISGSSRVRQDLSHALEMGRKVTAKIKWLSTNLKASTKWIHCTPLLGGNDTVGVWMVILVDAGPDEDAHRDWETAEPEVRVAAKGTNFTSDPIPWASTGQKKKTAGAVTTSIWSEGRYSDQTGDKAVQKDLKSAGGAPLPEMVRPPNLPMNGSGQASRVGSHTYPHTPLDQKPAATPDDFSIGGINGWQGSIDNRPTSHDGRPTSDDNGPSSSGSSRVSMQTQLRPTVRIAGRLSYEDPKPAPIKVPGSPQPNADDASNGLPPVKKRTYKSLSPYGILFDD